MHATFINELLRGAAEGRAVDPAAVAFEPWPRERQRGVWPSVASGYLYTRHQMLGLDIAMSFVTKLQAAAWRRAARQLAEPADDP